jgi:serine/threonine-protein kinase
MSSKDSTPLLFAGRYRLERPIGSGRTSTVWAGWDETLDRAVAVKVVSVSLLPHRKLCARLLRETRIAAGLTHPGLPVIYDFGEASVPGGSETPYVVMEFLEGESLAARLARGPLPSHEASRLCVVTANALATAHEAGLVHRQLRPTKIFLTENGVKLLGLGTSQAVDDPRAGSGPSKPDTSPYTAPEQLAGRSVTSAADVFALGIVLAEALTGRLPSEAALPSDVPDTIGLLCKRCGVADPGARPTAAQMANILAAFAVAARTSVATTAIALKSHADPPVPARTSWLAELSRITTIRKRRRLNLVMIALAPIVLIALILGISGFVFGGPSSPEAKSPVSRPASDSSIVTNEPTVEPAPESTTVEPTTVDPTPLDPTPSDPTPLDPTPAPTTRTPKPAPTATSSAAPPEPTQTATATPRPRSPRPSPQQPQISTDQALNMVRQSVSQGVNAGEIRQDVGLDLDNVVGNLQRDLARGQQVDLPQRVAEIRNKIATRLREGAITQNRANTLISLLPKV